MIVFAQSATEQKLDAWCDGELVKSDNQAFVTNIETATRIGLSRRSFTSNDTDIWVGRGMVRIDFKGLKDAAGRFSPVVVAFTRRELATNKALVPTIESGSSAIGRRVPADRIQSAVRECSKLIEVAQARQRRALLVAIAIIGIVAVSFIVLRSLAE